MGDARQGRSLFLNQSLWKYEGFQSLDKHNYLVTSPGSRIETIMAMWKENYREEKVGLESPAHRNIIIIIIVFLDNHIAAGFLYSIHEIMKSKANII